jgi:hypothetical protein
MKTNSHVPYHLHSVIRLTSKDVFASVGHAKHPTASGTAAIIATFFFAFQDLLASCFVIGPIPFKTSAVRPHKTPLGPMPFAL